MQNGKKVHSKVHDVNANSNKIQVHPSFFFYYTFIFVEKVCLSKLFRFLSFCDVTIMGHSRFKIQRLKKLEKTENKERKKQNHISKLKPNKPKHKKTRKANNKNKEGVIHSSHTLQMLLQRGVVLRDSYRGTIGDLKQHMHDTLISVEINAHRELSSTK